MVLMTKFDRSFAASQWLRVLKKELAGQWSLGIWLKQTDVHLKDCIIL